MKIPNSFKTSLEHLEAAENKEKIIEQEKEKNYSELVKEHNKQEESLLMKKIELCKRLFAWKEEFLKTEEGKKSFERSYKNLWVFGGGWAHQLPHYGGGGCWSRIYFNKTSIEYWAGYKWMPTGPRVNYTKPEEMAKMLDYKYLQGIIEAIDSRKIFKTILSLNEDDD